MLKGRALRGVEGSAQRASVLAGRRGGEYGQQRWGSGPQGHVKAVPCPLTSECLHRPGRHTAGQQTETGRTVSTDHYRDNVTPNIQGDCQKWSLLTNCGWVRISSTAPTFNEAFNKGFINGPVKEAPPWPQLHKNSLENMTQLLVFFKHFAFIVK